MKGNSTQHPIFNSPDLLDLIAYPKDPLYNFGSKIRDTDNEVFFTDSHVCSCCGSCHWGGDRGDYFLNTILVLSILSSTKSESFYNDPGPCKWKQLNIVQYLVHQNKKKLSNNNPGPCKWKQLRQEPGQTYRGGRSRVSRTGLPLQCVSFFAKYFFFQIHRS